MNDINCGDTVWVSGKVQAINYKDTPSEFYAVYTKHGYVHPSCRAALRQESLARIMAAIAPIKAAFDDGLLDIDEDAFAYEALRELTTDDIEHTTHIIGNMP